MYNKSYSNLSAPDSLVRVIVQTTGTVLLLLFLVKGVLQHICTDSTSNSRTGSAEESSAGLVSSPGGTTTADEGSSETSFTVGAYGSIGSAGSARTARPGRTSGILALGLGMGSTASVVCCRAARLAVLLGRVGRVAAVTAVLVIALLTRRVGRLLLVVLILVLVGVLVAGLLTVVLLDELLISFG